MRQLFKKIILILDGTPRVSRKRQSGQSLVELALVTPLLIMLLAGLVEIGWFANNFLTLLDVARAGARRGATLQDDQSARAWEDGFADWTYIDIGSLPTTPVDFQAQGIGVMPYSTGSTDPNDTDPLVVAERNQREGSRDTTNATDAHCRVGTNGHWASEGFYPQVICLMLDSLEPLRFNGSNSVDDIVVSGFAVEMIDPPDGASGDWLGSNRPQPGDNPQIVVVGRFPSNANECDATLISGTATVSAQEPRDPFDFNENNMVDVLGLASSNSHFRTSANFTEMFGGIPADDILRWGYDPITATVESAEKQVGFVWTGNHRIGETMCIGSDWTVSEVEDLFNLSGFDFVNHAPRGDQDRDLIPGQGLVLVEIFWEHKLLLNLPFFTVLNDRFSVNVWSAFPMQSVQPNIIFAS